MIMSYLYSAIKIVLLIITIRSENALCYSSKSLLESDLDGLLYTGHNHMYMESQEQWKDIEGYEDYYEISSMGRIRTKPRIIRHWKGGTSNRNMKVIYLGMKPDKLGYYRITLTGHDSKKKTYQVHRLVAKAFILNSDNKPWINHIDCNPSNNSIDNLEWCTASENLIHAFNTGRKISHKGEKCGVSVLTEKQVLEIRNKYVPRKYSYYKLANEYNIEPTTVYNIVARKTWKHI